jgi:hypothetical protein
VLLLGGGGRALGATPPLQWRADRELMDAAIDGWPLPKLLAALAAATGWEVYVEPDTEQTVTTRFQQLRPAEALPRLLGDLNFALVPQTSGPARIFVYRASLAGATRFVPPLRTLPAQADTRKPIPNELIVRLKPGSPDSIQELARRLGAKVVGALEALGAYRLEFPDEASARRAREQLAQEGDSRSLESNYALVTPPPLEPLAAGSRAGASVRADTLAGSAEFVVALIDTPVAVEGSRVKDFLLPGISVVGPAAAQGLTHGTAMAETILHGLTGPVSDLAGTPVRILPVDVYGPNPSTTTFDVARGIYAAAQANPAIINLSLGTEADTPFLRQVIEEVRQRGVLVIAAAGNEPVTTPVYPAAYPQVLAVTAGDAQGRIAGYANRGDFVDVVGPGSGLVHYQDVTYLGRGSSFAAAYVSGLAARLALQSGRPLAEVEATLRQQWAAPQVKGP